MINYSAIIEKWGSNCFPTFILFFAAIINISVEKQENNSYKYLK